MAPHRGDAPVDRALREGQERVRAHPREARHLAALAQLFVRKARDAEDPAFYAQAEDAVRRALDLDARSPEALQARALLFLQAHRFRDARDAARALVARSPNADAFGILSDALLELGDYDGSLDAAQSMIDLRPDGASYVRAAWLRWLHGDVTGAFEAMDLAQDAAPRAPEAHAWILSQRGYLHWAMGQLDEAARAYERAGRAFAGYSSAHAGLARVALARGDVAAAVRESAAAVERSGTLEHRWVAYDALRAANRRDEAERLFSESSRIGERTDPRTLALWLATLGREPDRALALARRDREERQDLFSDEAYAWALFRAGNTAEARAVMDRTRALEVRDPRVLYHRARVLLATGSAAEGRRALELALGTNPHWNADESVEARRMLHALDGAPSAVPSAPARAGARAAP